MDCFGRMVGAPWTSSKGKPQFYNACDIPPFLATMVQWYVIVQKAWILASCPGWFVVPPWKMKSPVVAGLMAYEIPG